MTTISRVKRRARGSPGDSPAGGSVVDAAPRFGADQRPRPASDTAVRQALLLQLALKALDRIIADYSGATQSRPSYAALAQYLDELERGQPAARSAEAPRKGSSSTETPALLLPLPRATAA
jgi:hypothetical protein